MRAWIDLNQQHLRCEINRVLMLLDGGSVAHPASGSELPTTALAMLGRMFRLSDFEMNVIVLCAGHVLEPKLAAKIGQRPNFGYALSVLPDSHLDAASPTGPLRLHRLVTLGSGDHALGAPLALDERILHFITGYAALDSRVLPYTMPVPRDGFVLTSSQQHLAQLLARTLANSDRAIVIQLIGSDAATRFAVLQAALDGQRTLIRMRASSLVLPAVELDALVRICERETLLANAMPVVEIDSSDGPEIVRAGRSFVDSSLCTLVVSASESVPMSRASVVILEVPASNSAERRSIWQQAFGSNASRFAAHIDRIAHQFRLVPSEITSIVHALDQDATIDDLWDACLKRSRPRVDGLARRITPAATWDDLVVPPSVLEPLQEAVMHLRHRHQVQEQWGFARGDSRGQAITALFCGPSGTGKTLAAEVIAREANLDLYHVDLSLVIDKYIGETEKRLGRIFDAAERGGAILLFDEADALFGKRANIERGSDRWANLEVSYLLQRMESYSGLAILTTNAKDALDSAFLRRLRFIVPFPFPDARLRTELWRRAFPTDAPTSGIDPEKLARLQLTGANIKSIALKAAFHAANEGTNVSMSHVLRAARSEYAKLELPFPDGDVRAWGNHGS